MKVQIDAKALTDFLKEELQLDEKKKAITGLSKIDWNPFNEDGDEHVGVWAEMKNNGRLIGEAIHAIVATLEVVVVEGQALSSPQKKKIAVDLLDDALKLPFFLEPFDGIALGMLIDMGVAQMNKVDWGTPPPTIEAPGYTWKEIG